MNTRLRRFELTRLTLSGAHFREPLGKAALALSQSGCLAVGFAGLLAILTAGAVFTLAKWPPPAGLEAGAGGRSETPLAAAASEPAQLVTAPSTLDDASLPPQTVLQQAAVSGGLKISSQRWRRGGLGSNALVSFTLRNANDYAVKDIEISCSFSRRDGSHLTDRTRIVHDTIKMKGRRSVAHWHIGFVNVNADRAKCAPVSATRI